MRLLRTERQRRLLRIRADRYDQVHALGQLGGRERRMRRAAEVALVEAGHVCRYELALAGREAVIGIVQQDLGQRAERHPGLWPETHKANNSGQVIAHADVRHQVLL